MDRVFVYWDNSNIFYVAQRLAEQREGPDARYRVRIDFDNLLRLAHADRPVEQAIAAGSVPPELRHLWNRMESLGVNVQLFDRGRPERGEQEVPDRVLQLRMLEHGWDYNGDPGIVALLTGDGAGYMEGTGFHSTLERMHTRGWRIEILSGPIPGTSGCAAGPNATAYSSRWTTSMTPSRSWNPHDQGRSLPRPATWSPSTHHADLWLQQELESSGTKVPITK